MRGTLLASALASLAVAAPAGAATFHWNGASGVVASPDGRNAYSTGYRTLSFSLDPGTGPPALIGHTEPGGSNSRIVISPDGRFVYTTALGAINILARDAETGLLTHEGTYVGDGTAESHKLRDVRDVEISHDGRFLYVTEMQPGVISTLERDATTGTLTERQVMYDAPVGYGFDIAITPDDRHLYVAGGGVAAFSRDATTGLLTSLPSHYVNTSAWHVAAAPDGKRMYAGMTDYGVYDRDAETGKLTLVDYADIAYPSCQGCGDSTPDSFISVAPDNGAIFSPDLRRRTMVQATPHPTEGAVHARTYGPAGFDVPIGFDWSSDGKLAFGVSGANYGDSRLTVYRRSADGIEPAASAGPNFDVPEDVDPGFARPAISIEDGALYTNDRDVQVTITRPMGVASMRLSNVAGDYTGSRFHRLPLFEQAFPWQLATTGPERSVKRVYVRLTMGGPPYELFDDIVLDERPPELLGVRISGSKLVSRARDNRSGVKRMQVTTNRKRPGKERKFAKRLGLKGSPKSVHVRVVDGAGNRSRWKIARRP